MKNFRDYLKEEVMPTALSDGSIDIKKDTVRAEINGIIAGIANKPCVTPYTALTKIRKALSYFHIDLPTKTYMEGGHGVEVWDIHQFGHKMGMNDQGEFIKDVPCDYYLYFHYHLMGSMFWVESKIVDREGLDKALDRIESMASMNEEAVDQLRKSVMSAPKEPMHDEDKGEEGTKKAVEVSMRRKDKKLSADQLDEVSSGLALRAARRAFAKSDKMKKDAQKEPDDHSYVQAFHKGVKKNKQGAKFLKYAAKKMNEEQIDEASDWIMRKFKTKIDTRVKKGLHKDGEKKTILVTLKGDPAATRGGGVRRIPKEKWDPSKYNMASE